MNYRHAFHAGNFADVIKHVALVAVLLHLRKKEKPFRVVDTHAGRGLYDIAGEAASRTGEAAFGFGRLDDLAADSTLPVALTTYLAIAQSWGRDIYPGSPLIAARLLRGTDKLIAIERHAEEEEALRAALAPFGNAKSYCADGYARLAALLPPPERRGLVLIDPPYESEDEFAHAARALAAARARFATGIYLLWHPVKSQAEADGLLGEVRGQGTEQVLRIAIDVGRNDAKDGKDRLSSASLLVVNPPYGLDEDMRSMVPALSPRLGRETPARISLELI